MSAWGEALGGPLSSDEADTVVRHIRSWATRAPVVLDAAPIQGQTARGRAQWDVRCAACHGAKGQGGTFMSVANPEFLAAVDDAYIRAAISDGRPGTVMEAWSDRLTGQAMDDLTALIRSWATPSERPANALVETDLSKVVLHPRGPAPAFGAQPGEFVSVDGLAEAMAAGSRMAILDARPPSDWAEERIAGAVSVPFYAAAELAPRLPRDVWMVSYCACPHAEAEQTAAALRSAGRTRIKVLDEGFREWKARGLPTEGRAGRDD